MLKFTILQFFLVTTIFLCSKSFSDQNDGVPSLESSISWPLVIKKDQRTPIVATEYGEISTVQIGDGYHIQFITLEPNSFLLPLLLHSDMVLFVHAGSGILNWIDEDKERKLELKRGDVFRLRSGTVLYLHSNLESERYEFQEKLRVYAIFDVGECLYEPCLGAYSDIRDLLLGFDERTLRTTFAVPEEVLGKLRNATKPPLITSSLPRKKTQWLEEETWQTRLVKLFVRAEDVTDHLAMKPVVNSKKKSCAYNVFDADPDFENVNGWSIVVDEKDMDPLKGSSVGVFMVNLTKGSMMGPHWNPSASEISIVLRGEGMVRVVNQPSSSSSKNKSERFMVEEGDVFVVPRFYPMAQMSFENSSFVFMGFSTSAETNYPQFLVGQSSVLKVFDREVLATSFNLRNETIERLLGTQKEGVILECASCAEVELTKLMREIEEKKRCEEEEIERKRKEEEEARKREEEIKREKEEAKRREEEKRRREEEEEIERRRKEEEEARKREEERKREEDAAKKQEEERRRREKQEEEARKREEEREREEEEAKRQEEERIRRDKEKEEARKREEEREKEEEMAKRREEERQRKAREEAERKRREEQEIKKREEEARKREEEREKEEEMAKRQEEERQRKAREEAERKRREEEARKREEEREKEEEMAKRAEEERQRKAREETERERREEQERKRREEEAMKREEERKREEEAAKRAEEERRRREEEEEKRRWPPQPQPPTTVKENVSEEDES